MKIDCQIERGIESRIKLPVVVAKSGLTYVIEPDGTDARILTGGNGDYQWAGSDRKTRAGTSTAIRICLRYPEVSAQAAKAALKQIEAQARARRYVHITIDAGAMAFEWWHLRKYAEEALGERDRKKLALGVTIDGAYRAPDDEHKDWLARNKITARYVFGRALGYAGAIAGEAEGVLRAMSGYGLRTPVLFYWAGEKENVVAEVLRNALRLNKLSGIGILPYYLSPRFQWNTGVTQETVNGFAEAVEYLLEDRIIGDELDEPVGAIEQRLTGRDSPRWLRYVINEQGQLRRFRRFAFAAGDKNTMCHKCRDCVWRHICGGIDSSPDGLKQQYKIIAEAWCGFREAIMRRVVRECLEIREYFYKHKIELAEAVS